MAAAAAVGPAAAGPIGGVREFREIPTASLTSAGIKLLTDTTAIVINAALPAVYVSGYTQGGQFRPIAALQLTLLAAEHSAAVNRVGVSPAVAENELIDLFGYVFKAINSPAPNYLYLKYVPKPSHARYYIGGDFSTYVETVETPVHLDIYGKDTPFTAIQDYRTINPLLHPYEYLINQLIQGATAVGVRDIKYMFLETSTISSIPPDLITQLNTYFRWKIAPGFDSVYICFQQSIVPADSTRHPLSMFMTNEVPGIVQEIWSYQRTTAPPAGRNSSKGTGAYLLKKMLQARRRDFPVIWLATVDQAPALQAMYRELGFVPVRPTQRPLGLEAAPEYSWDIATASRMSPLGIQAPNAGGMQSYVYGAAPAAPIEIPILALKRMGSLRIEFLLEPAIIKEIRERFVLAARTEHSLVFFGQRAGPVVGTVQWAGSALRAKFQGIASPPAPAGGFVLEGGRLVEKVNISSPMINPLMAANSIMGHTHPVSLYRAMGIRFSPPSGSDLRIALQFKQKLHLVFAHECIYAVRCVYPGPVDAATVAAFQAIQPEYESIFELMSIGTAAEIGAKMMKVLAPLIPAAAPAGTLEDVVRIALTDPIAFFLKIVNGILRGPAGQRLFDMSVHAYMPTGEIVPPIFYWDRDFLNTHVLTVGEHAMFGPEVVLRPVIEPAVKAAAAAAEMRVDRLEGAIAGPAGGVEPGTPLGPEQAIAAGEELKALGLPQGAVQAPVP